MAPIRVGRHATESSDKSEPGEASTGNPSSEDVRSQRKKDECWQMRGAEAARKRRESGAAPILTITICHPCNHPCHPGAEACTKTVGG
eukprot:scaffold156675_cov18-Tisochrysis_lutea.AAC.1